MRLNQLLCPYMTCTRTAFDIVEPLIRSLHDPNQISTSDILQCGPEVLPILLRAFTQPICASSLLALANEHIQSTPFNLVRRQWLRLYVDASIALSLHDADGVRLLDMSIIVAGAVGCGRMECIQELIRKLQGSVESFHPVAAPSPYLCSSTEDDIPSIVPPSLHAYRAFRAPFILRKYLSWPALVKWTSFDYLLHASGPGRVVPVERGKAYDHPDWGQEIIPWRDFLLMMAASTPNQNPPYLAQYSLLNQIPSLMTDIATPDYVWTEPELPHDRPAEPITNVWIGNGLDGVVSPPHTDPYFNCYAQVLGHKRIWLAPPEANVQPYGESDDLTGYMRNTSPLQVFESVCEGMYATLHPGDLLVFPPKWWHSTKAVGSGMVWNISFWY